MTVIRKGVKRTPSRTITETISARSAATAPATRSASRFSPRATRDAHRRAARHGRARRRPSASRSAGTDPASQPVDKHVVRRGDTLWSIARTPRRNMDTLATPTASSRNGTLAVGQVLTIPGTTTLASVDPARSARSRRPTSCAEATRSRASPPSSACACQICSVGTS